jgi:hypothetical protein
LAHGTDPGALFRRGPELARTIGPRQYKKKTEFLMIEMISVASSNLESIGYDAGSCELYVRYKTGETYLYQNVPQQVFDELMAADSKGSYMNRIIKPAYRSYYKQ